MPDTVICFTPKHMQIYWYSSPGFNSHEAETGETVQEFSINSSCLIKSLRGLGSKTNVSLYYELHHKVKKKIRQPVFIVPP